MIPRYYTEFEEWALEREQVASGAKPAMRKKPLVLAAAISAVIWAVVFVVARGV